MLFNRLRIIYYCCLWCYNPALEEGKNHSNRMARTELERIPRFHEGRVRYAPAMKQYSAEAEELFKGAEANAK